jgi:hypothetical protein
MSFPDASTQLGSSITGRLVRRFDCFENAFADIGARLRIALDRN